LTSLRCSFPPVLIGHQKPFFGKLLLIPQILIPSFATMNTQHMHCRNASEPSILARLCPAVLLASFLLVIASSTPAFAQRCSTQNGQTICCDNSGNCYSR
jgi:predicted transporter